jgi:hypothetical protein
LAYIRGVERRSPVFLKLVNKVLNWLVEAFFQGAAYPEEA